MWAPLDIHKTILQILKIFFLFFIFLQFINYKKKTKRAPVQKVWEPFWIILCYF